MRARNQAIAKRVGLYLAATAWARTFHYIRAARCDEENGFPYTAASEWRKAAELLNWNTLAADYAWRQWERIMQLPRRMAAASSSVTSAPEGCSRPKRHHHGMRASLVHARLEVTSATPRG